MEKVTVHNLYSFSQKVCNLYMSLEYPKVQWTMLTLSWIYHQRFHSHINIFIWNIFKTNRNVFKVCCLPLMWNFPVLSFTWKTSHWEERRQTGTLRLLAVLSSTACSRSDTWISWVVGNVCGRVRSGFLRTSGGILFVLSWQCSAQRWPQERCEFLDERKICWRRLRQEHILWKKKIKLITIKKIIIICTNSHLKLCIRKIFYWVIPW